MRRYKFFSFGPLKLIMVTDRCHCLNFLPTQRVDRIQPKSQAGFQFRSKLHPNTSRPRGEPKYKDLKALAPLKPKKKSKTPYRF